MTRFSREFYLIIGLATTAFIAGNMVQSFFSLYVNERGASPLELGLIVSTMSYTILATQIPLGMITQRVGSRWIVPLALVGQSFAYVLYSIADLPYFFLIRIVHAIASAALTPILLSLASAIAPEDRRGEGIGFYLTAAGLASMGGPLLCSFLLAYFSYTTILLISSVIPLLALAAYIGLLKKTALRKHFAETARNTSFSKSSWSLRRIIGLRQVQTISYIRFTFAFTMSILTTIYAVHVVNNLNISPAIYAFYITIRGGTNTLSRLPAGKISDAIGRKIPLLIAFVTLTGVFFLFSITTNPIIIGLLMLLHGAAHGTRAVSEWSLLADMVRKDDRSLANFYFSTVFTLGSAIGATFAGSAATMISTPSILKIAAMLTSSSIIIIVLTKSRVMRET